MLIKWPANTLNIVILGLLPIYILIHTYLLPYNLSASGIADPGFISVITMTILVCVLLILINLSLQENLAVPKFSVICMTYALVIYFLREADFHRLFTAEHVTKAKYYFMQTVPLWERLIAGIVMLLLFMSLLYLLYTYSRVWWTKLKQFEPWVVSLLLWFITLFLSQLCDKSDLNHTHLGRVIEECLELWAAIYIFLAAIQAMPKAFASGTTNTK